MSPAEIAAIGLGGDVRDVSTVERIKHGLTNESWLVTLGAESVVVRISNPSEASLQIDRGSEAIILQAVAEAGIGSPVVWCDPASRVLVTRYLGPNWTEADARNPAKMARLGAVLRKLHALPVPSEAHSVRLLDVIDDYAATLSLVAADSSSLKHREARSTAKELDNGRPRCLCHNDVHALNIIDAGSAPDDIRLIDWEYAGVGSPLFDLASVCVYHRYDRAQRTQLLSSYAPPGEVTMKALERACGVFDYIRELWLRVRAATDPRPG